GWPAMFLIIRAIALYGLLYACIVTAIGLEGVPRTVGLIQPLLLFFAISGSRALAHYWLGGLHRSKSQIAALPKVLIYGAGTAGQQLNAALVNGLEMRVVGFLDDDDLLQGNMLNGQPVYSPDALADLIKSNGGSHVLLAIPRASRRRRNEILERVRGYPVAVRTLPSVNDLAEGRVSVSDLHELDIDDLLGRDQVPPDHNLLSKNITDKVVLVTGAGGSIGSELCRQIRIVAPAKLLLIEQSEFALYSIHEELLGLQSADDGLQFDIVPLLASVQDEEWMRRVMSAWHPDTVYHAAAYKHVPMVEHNPVMGIRNNLLGTLKTAKAAAENGVSDFVLISTDKAVRPTNIMGASKRLAEMVLQAMVATVSSTKFTMVRFGNVLESSGSVVPKFRQQIHDGGPVTLTHAEITRFFMTISEAAQLVIQAGALAEGGDVFVLDMGQPIKVMDLARRMIELSGLIVKDEQNPDGDIEIKITGLRPGEKLYEELIIGNNPTPTSHPKILKAHEDFIIWPEMESKLDALETAMNANDVSATRLIMKQLVNGYTPSGKIVDWVSLEKTASST
ncbi:MAG TPA: polysaccharide biosynthesis protein, partial [Gammaproteobacteria bacterium]|nr:polysaccharide biosynthesis protein [Gammaproteobacteria bacterium]